MKRKQFPVLEGRKGDWTGLSMLTTRRRSPCEADFSEVLLLEGRKQCTSLCMDLYPIKHYIALNLSSHSSQLVWRGQLCRFIYKAEEMAMTITQMRSKSLEVRRGKESDQETWM